MPPAAANDRRTFPLAFSGEMRYNYYQRAGVMELVDVVDSKSCSSIHVRLAGTLDITAFPETQEAFDFNIPPAYPSKF